MLFFIFLICQIFLVLFVLYLLYEKPPNIALSGLYDLTESYCFCTKSFIYMIGKSDYCNVTALHFNIMACDFQSFFKRNVVCFHKLHGFTSSEECINVNSFFSALSNPLVPGTALLCHVWFLILICSNLEIKNQISVIFFNPEVFHACQISVSIPVFIQSRISHIM